MEGTAEAHPRFKARMAGVSYLLTAAAYGVGQLFILGELVVHSDASATASNILAHESLLRLGFAADIVSVAFSIVLTVLFYDLFKPVNRSLSLLAAFVRLVGSAIAAFGSGLWQRPLAASFFSLPWSSGEAGST